MTIVQKIKDLLREQGISQKVMLSNLKMSPNILNEWEKNKRTPNLSSLSRIADYLNVSVEYLQGISEIRNPELDKEHQIEIAVSWFDEYEITIESYNNDNGIGEEYVLTYDGVSINMQQWEFENLCCDLVTHSKNAYDLVMKDMIACYFKKSTFEKLDEDEIALLTAFRELKGMKRLNIIHYCLQALEENAKEKGQVSS